MTHHNPQSDLSDADPSRPTSGPHRTKPRNDGRVPDAPTTMTSLSRAKKQV